MVDRHSAAVSLPELFMNVAKVSLNQHPSCADGFDNVGKRLLREVVNLIRDHGRQSDIPIG